MKEQCALRMLGWERRDRVLASRRTSSKSGRERSRSMDLIATAAEFMGMQRAGFVDKGAHALANLVQELVGGRVQWVLDPFASCCFFCSVGCGHAILHVCEVQEYGACME